MKDIVLLNETTGEFLDSSEYKITKATNKLSEAEVVITLEEVLSGKIDHENLLGYLKRINEINSYGFMKISSVYVDPKIFKISIGTGFEREIITLIGLVSNRNTIKSTFDENCRTNCKTWQDLYSAIKITNRTKRSKFKKFVSENDIVRMLSISTTNLEDNNSLYFNPNFFRYGSHASMASISCFKDLTLKKIHRYNTFVLYMNGMIKKEDL